METPADVTLPFFTYGLFRPGQIGFRDLRPVVEREEDEWQIKGQLLERDGLPILDNGNSNVSGVLIHFRPDSALGGYQIVTRVEPDKLYRWEVKEVKKGRQKVQANVLVGRKPDRGGHPLDANGWDGRQEPLFTTALEIVQETLDHNKHFEWDLKPLFRLQMAYMLLWSAIERFASFKYHLGNKATEKVFQLADEPLFASTLGELVSESRTVFRADDPERKETLDPAQPKKALGYYYQVRSNIVHRGKAAVRDHDILLSSLSELYEIFRRILGAEFETA